MKKIRFGKKGSALRTSIEENSSIIKRTDPVETIPTAKQQQWMKNFTADQCLIPFVAVAKKTLATGFHFKATGPSNDLMSLQRQASIPFEKIIVDRLEKVEGEDFSTYNTSFLPNEKLKWFVTKRREWIYILVTDQDYPYRIAIECIESLIRLFAPLKQRRKTEWVRTACCDHIVEEWGVLKQGTLLWEMLQEEEGEQQQRQPSPPVPRQQEQHQHRQQQEQQREENESNILCARDQEEEEEEENIRRREAEMESRKKIADLEKLVSNLTRILEVKDETEHLLQKQLDAKTEATSHMEKELQRMNGRSKTLLEQTKTLKESIEHFTKRPSSKREDDDDDENGKNTNEGTDGKNAWKVKRFVSLSKKWIEKLQCASPFDFKDRDDMIYTDDSNSMELTSSSLSAPSSPSTLSSSSKRNPLIDRSNEKSTVPSSQKSLYAAEYHKKPYSSVERPVQQHNPFEHDFDIDHETNVDHHHRRRRRLNNQKYHHHHHESRLTMNEVPSRNSSNLQSVDESNNPFAY